MAHACAALAAGHASVDEETQRYKRQSIGKMTERRNSDARRDSIARLRANGEAREMDARAVANAAVVDTDIG